MPTPFRPKSIPYPHLRNEPPEKLVDQAADIAIPITEDATHLLSKTSAGAYSVAAPGAANVGRKLRFRGVTDFAHVLTFTGSTLRDGTTGVSITWTTTAFRGCALEVQAVDASIWQVTYMNLGAIA